MPLKRNIGYEDAEDETPSRNKHLRTGENNRAGEGTRGNGDDGSREPLNSTVGPVQGEQNEAQEMIDDMPVDE